MSMRYLNSMYVDTELESLQGIILTMVELMSKFASTGKGKRRHMMSIELNSETDIVKFKNIIHDFKLNARGVKLKYKIINNAVTYGRHKVDKIAYIDMWLTNKNMFSGYINKIARFYYKYKYQNNIFMTVILTIICLLTLKGIGVI